MKLLLHLFKIEGTLNQHGHHSILQEHAIQAGLRLVKSFIFQHDNDSKRLLVVLWLFDLEGE